MEKKYRLKKNKSFNYIYKNGKSLANKKLVLIYVPTKFNLQVGFSVSKKIGNAVIRNKVKRRLREGFRSIIKSIRGNHHYVVVARIGTESMDYQSLLVSLIHLFKKAGLYIEGKENEDNRKSDS